MCISKVNEEGGPVSRSQLDGRNENAEEGDRCNEIVDNSNDEIDRNNNDELDYSNRDDIAVDELDDTNHGEEITSKRQNTLRVGFLNINGLPDNKEHPKI